MFIYIIHYFHDVVYNMWIFDLCTQINTEIFKLYISCVWYVLLNILITVRLNKKYICLVILYLYSNVIICKKKNKISYYRLIINYVNHSYFLEYIFSIFFCSLYCRTYRITKLFITIRKYNKYCFIIKPPY